MAVVLALVLGIAPMSALAQSKGPTGRSGEVTTFKRDVPKETKADKDAKVEKKKGPAAPEQRRSRERTSTEDIDDELAILRELLEIERGSETEGDTLLEVSYVLWDRAEAYEMEAYDLKYEVGIAEAEARGDKKAAQILKAEQAMLLEQSRSAKLDVVNHLKRIERNFPKYAKLDEVLYSLGFHLSELERPGESVDAYMRLVRKVPHSGYLPDAYLGIGNYYFGKNQGTEALKWYAKVTEFPDASVYGWGLYYIAWVHYNQQHWDLAIKGFVRVLDYSKNEARGRVAFMEDGSRYLVRSWAETGNPKNALAFFKKSVPGAEILLLEALSAHYIDVSEFAKSNIILDELIELSHNDKAIVRYVGTRVENSYKLHDLDQTTLSVVRLGNAVKTAGGAGDRAIALELLLAEISSTYHAEYERTLTKATLEAAEKVYHVYGDLFPHGEHAYDMLHNHGLALFQLERWTDSAAMYEHVIDMQPDGKYAEPSAHRALIAYLKLQDLNAETQDKSVDAADLRPIPLSNEQQRVADACERYINIAIKNDTKEDVPEALFVVGRLYYQTNHFDKSGPLLAKFVDRFADHPKLALDAARLMLSSFNLGMDGKNLILWTNKLLGDARFNQGKLGETLVAIKSNEEYNKCLELKETPVKAAECLTKYAASFPESKQAPRALAGAARFYREAKQRDNVIATYRNLAKTYPNDARAAQSAFEIGEIYRESAAFEDAAKAYEDFVKAWPDSKLVPQALATATRIRESLGHYDQVVADGELFLDHFAKDERAVQVAYKLTVEYIKKNDWKGVIRASDKFLKRSLNIPTELRLAAMVNTGTAQQKLNMGDKGRKLFDDVIRQAEEIAKAGKMGELPEIGRDAIAQALFMTGEIEFEKVKALKGNPKDLKAASELATKKVKAATGADKFYAEAESAKNPRWVAAAASRRGRIYQEIANSIKTLPPPPALARSEELKSEWASQLAEKAKPHEETAIARYREALKKAAEIFAFDSYWAEARDNLKILDTKFAELADVKEFAVEVAPVTWTDGQKPAEAVKDLRYKLFDLSSGAAVEDGKTPVETTKVAGPEVASAYARLASAHYALGQQRETQVVALVGQQLAPELKKSAVLLNMLGLSHVALGETREALLNFRDAAAADPKATEPLLNAAAISIRNLDFEATVALLDEVLKRDPANYWAQVTRPVALRRVSDDPAKAKEALDSLDQLAKSQPRVEGMYNRCVIAQATLTAGKPALQQALEACKEAQKVAGASSSLAKELTKRVQGIAQAIEFSP